MKRILSRVCSFLAFVVVSIAGMSSIHAQAITISQEVGLKNDYAYSILGWVGDNMLLFRDKGNQFFIQAFDEDLHKKWEREMYLGDGRPNIIGTISHSDRFHVLFGTRIKGIYHIQHYVYSHDINLIDSSSINVYENAFVTPRIFMVESADKSKVLLFEYQKRGLTLMTYDLDSKTSGKVHRLTIDGKNLIDDFRTIVLNNEGEFFVAMQSAKPQHRSQYLHIYGASLASKQLSLDTIRLGEVELKDIYPVFDHEHNCLVITGLYGSRTNTKSKGVYLIKHFSDRKPVIRLQPFDEALLSEINGKGSSSQKGVSDFVIQDVALRKDGGAIIIAEMVKEFSRRSSLPMQRGMGTYMRDGWVDYYFEDMILFALHPDGTKHWADVLRKRQYSQDDGAMYSSFMLFRTPERLRFLFNDEIKHENTVGGYEVSGTGFVERKTVFNTDYHKLKLRFMDGIQVAHNECIVPSERNNRLNLVRILFYE